MAELIIDPKQVNKTFIETLYTDSELAGIEGPPEGCVIVEGIVNRYGFHPGRLEERRDEVRRWLKALSQKFCEGWSFLNACDQANGVQWTGLHLRMEQLFCLGMGLGIVKSVFPRRMWANLPGGMPYYVIELEKEVDNV